MIKLHRYNFLTIAAVLCCSFTPVSLLAKEVLARPLVTTPGQSEFRKTGVMRKADTALSSVFSEFQSHAALVAKTGGPKTASATFRPSHSFVQFGQGAIEIVATAHENGQELLDDLLKMGLQDGEKYGLMVGGKLPVAQIENAASLDSLQNISAARAPIRNDSGVAPTPGFPQGDKALRASNARTAYSVDGTAITVAVISDTYDQSDLSPATDAAADIISGDLPAGDPVIPGSAYTNCGGGLFQATCTDEGRAMLQIVHDLAPAAPLLFHTGLSNQVKYANAITTLVNAGADVIVDDLSYLDEPMFQDGIIAQSVDAAVASGVTYFSAAGNGARRSYEGAFEDSGELYCLDNFPLGLPDGFCDPIYELVGPMHDFNTASGESNIDTLLSVTVPIGATISIVLQWNDPFGSVQTGSGPERDHVLILLDSLGTTQYAIGASDNVLTGSPVEVAQFVNSSAETSLNLAIAYDAVDSQSAPADLLKMVIYGSGGIVLNEYTTDDSTIVGHANAAGAIAVGASDYLNTPEFLVDPPLLEPYSSAGGTPILFDTSGTALPAPVIREKPEIVAVDGVSTTFFSSQQVGDSLPDFFGTSAAAPHAAAVAALVKQANPSIPPWKIANALKTTAIDMTATAGFDFDSGYGLIQADAAVAAAIAVVADPSALVTTAIFASQVDLSWTDNSGNETGFDVERSPASAGTWVLAGSTGVDVNVFSDTGLSSNTPYDYRVKATYNAGTDSGYSNTVSAMTLDSCPAGPHDLISGVWHMFSLPCDPSPANKVTDIFPDQNPLKYVSHWIVYSYDAVNDTYDQLPVDGVLSEGVGYFTFLSQSDSITVNGSPYAPIDIPLQADGVDMQFNLLGHNRNGYVAWADVEVIDTDDGNTAYTLAQADPDLGGELGLACAQSPPDASCLMSRKMHKWNGAVYIMADGETEGMEGSLLPFDGFWVSAFKSGTNGIKLRIPPPSLPPVPSVAMAVSKTDSSATTTVTATASSKGKKPTAQPWFIRLIAESEGKQDPGNVLGQMATSTNGQDRHDLKEKYPFDSRYLSILFTNPEFENTDWGFTSDFRKLGKTAKGRWPFVVKASSDVEEVTLRWEGDTALFEKAYLLDVQKGRNVKASPDGSYTFEVTAEESPFVFILK